MTIGPQELALRATDPALSQQEREVAFAELVPVIESLAARCAARLIASGQVKLDLQSQARTHIYDALDTFNRTQEFMPWASKVLTNLGHEIRRGEERSRAKQRRWIERASRPERLPTDEGLEMLGEEFSRMRAGLDRIRWSATGQVDYYAVLLVLCRTELACVARRSGFDGGPRSLAELIEGWLPWHTDELHLRFRPGLPSLSELWHHLAPELGPSAALALVLSSLNALVANAPVRYTSLNMWCYRARNEAGARLGPDWEHLGFAALLGRTQQEGL